MLTRIFAIISCVLLFLSSIAAADNMQPIPIDRATLPQAAITSDFGKSILAALKSRNMPVYGTAEDRSKHFMIWYTAKANNHSCVLGKPEIMEYQIISQNMCVDLYELGIANGDYPSL